MGIESQIDAREAAGASDELHRAERQHDGERDLAAHEREPRPSAFGAAALDGALPQRLPRRAARDFPDRQQAKQHQSDQRKSSREEQQIPADRDLLPARHRVRNDAAHAGDAGGREHAARQHAAQAEERALGEHVEHERTPARADGAAQREIAVAGFEPRDHQRRRVANGDQQQQKHAAHRCPQRRPDVLHHVVEQRMDREGDGRVRVFLRVLLEQ